METVTFVRLKQPAGRFFFALLVQRDRRALSPPALCFAADPEHCLPHGWVFGRDPPNVRYYRKVGEINMYRMVLQGSINGTV